MLRFWFKKEHLYEGRQRDERIAATASVDLSRVGVERKLLVAARYSAQCGAPTLDRSFSSKPNAAQSGRRLVTTTAPRFPCWRSATEPA